jgi:diguanylate cyclase (GGDEF)-like protein
MSKSVSVEHAIAPNILWDGAFYRGLVAESVGTPLQMSRLRAAQHRISSVMAPLVVPANLISGFYLLWMVQDSLGTRHFALCAAGLALVCLASCFAWKQPERRQKISATQQRTTISIVYAAIHAAYVAYIFYLSLLFLTVDLQYLPAILWCCFVTIGAMVTAPVARTSLVFIITASVCGCMATILSGVPQPFLMCGAFLMLGLLAAFCSAMFALTFARRHFAGIALDERNQDVSLLMRDFMEVSSHWLWRITAEGKFINVPDILATFLGKTKDDLVGTSLMDHMNQLTLKQSRYTDEGDKLLMLANQLHMKQAFKDFAFQVAHADRRSWWSFTAQPVFDALGNFDGYRGVIADVSVRFAETQEIIQLAHYDSLTGLHNRASFADQIGSAWHRCKITGREFALLSIDLDHFKQVNDTFGHQAGDALLREAAQRIISVIGPRDVAARLGGDEFAILHWIEGAHDYLPIMAQKIIAHLHEIFVIDNCPMRIGASIGMAIAPLHGTDPDSLARNADAALYQAKAAGRGTAVMFDETMQDWLRRRRRLEADLRVAVSHGDLQIAYQPIIDTDKRSIGSCEALVRWNHPEFGWVSPGEFIPIAEESGIIVALGEWVLNQACKTAMAWPKSISVAVNLSSHQLQAGTLLKVVEEALLSSGLDARRLDLEVTETVVLDATQSILDVMHALRAMGVRISLDDFGTGYSSLSYLRSFPFDRIKIDRSFVIDALESPTSAAIIETIVQLAQRLNMGLTVEGVETMAQFDMVRRLGASCIQGYLFSKPLLSADLDLWFEAQQQRVLSTPEDMRYRQAS